MKKLSLITILSLLVINLFAQSPKQNLFIQSLERNIGYPEYLSAHCIPTSCLLKAEIINGKVASVKLSDSAEKLLQVEFAAKMKYLNIIALENYCRQANINNIIFVIPINYILDQRECAVLNTDTALTPHYMEFEGKALTGNVTVLPGTTITVSQPIR